MARKKAAAAADAVANRGTIEIAIRNADGVLTHHVRDDVADVDALVEVLQETPIDLAGDRLLTLVQHDAATGGDAST